MPAGLCFEAAHISGVKNVLAAGISRWPRESIKFVIVFPSPACALAGGKFGEERWNDVGACTLIGDGRNGSFDERHF